MAGDLHEWVGSGVPSQKWLGLDKAEGAALLQISVGMRDNKSSIIKSSNMYIYKMLTSSPSKKYNILSFTTDMCPIEHSLQSMTFRLR